MKYIVTKQLTGRRPTDQHTLDALRYMMAAPLVVSAAEPPKIEFRWGLLRTWKRILERRPMLASMALMALTAPGPCAVLIAAYRFTHGRTPDYGPAWAFAAWFVSMLAVLGSVSVSMLVSELMRDNRAMRVRFKMRTGEDYDGDPFA